MKARPWIFYATLPLRGRDLRFNLIRGLANWAIFLDHIPHDVVSWLTLRNYGFSDAAEFFVFISGYTAGFVYGPAIDGWRTRDIAGQEATLSCNGKPRRKGTAAAALDHPLVPLTWLANELSRTGVGMKAGQMISTGTLTGMLAPKPGETYVADFGPFGSVTLTFTS